MRDVARAAGVSVGTASKALRNSPELPHETCARIQEVALKVGYRCDAQISRHMAYLRKDRSEKGTFPLALLHNFVSGKHFESPAAQEERLVLQSLGARAETLGYHLDVFGLRDPELPPKRLKRVLCARACQGLVFWGPVIKELPFDLTGFSSVCLGKCMDTTMLHTVMRDSASQVELVFNEMLGRGYKRVGLAVFTLEPERIELEESRYAHEVLAGEISDPIPSFKSTAYRPEPLLEWIDEHRPEAIWTNLPAAVDWIKAARIRIPEDLAVASYVTPALDPWGSGVDRSVKDHAKAAIDLLVGQIHRNETGIPELAHKVVIQGRWVEGKSMPHKQQRGTLSKPKRVVSPPRSDSVGRGSRDGHPED